MNNDHVIKIVIAHNPLVEGSNPSGPIKQHPENKAVTETDGPSSESPNQFLVSDRFLESEIDPDLKLIIEHWPKLSVELRQAIVKMVR